MFKNAQLFRLTEQFTPDAAVLEERLSTLRFRPCGPAETERWGWSSPLGDETTALVHAVGGCLLMCARKQERLLPAAAVSEAVDERIAEIKAGELREVGRAERRRLREQIVNEMLPQAFTQSRRTMLYIDTVAGWIVVDAASPKQAEDVVSLLRETLGSLPARLPAPSQNPSTVMTGWLPDDSLPADFVLGDACELRDPVGGGEIVRITGMDLEGDEVREHLRAGKVVTKLALNWDERLLFTLDDDLALKRMAMADALLDEIDTDAEQTPAERIDAEFALFALQMRALIGRLSELFGLIQEV